MESLWSPWIDLMMEWFESEVWPEQRLERAWAAYSVCIKEGVVFR